MIAFYQPSAQIQQEVDQMGEGGGAHNFYVGEAPVQCMLTKIEEIDNPYTKKGEQPRKVAAVWYVVTAGEFQHTECVDYFDFTTPDRFDSGGSVSAANYKRFDGLCKALGLQGYSQIRQLEDLLNTSRKFVAEHKTITGHQKKDANNMPAYKADGTPDLWPNTSRTKKYSALPQVAAPQAPVQQQPVQPQFQQPIQPAINDDIPF